MAANSKIFIASKDVYVGEINTGKQHLYLVYDADGIVGTTNDQRVIRAGFNLGNGSSHFNILIESNVLIETSADSYGDTSSPLLRGMYEIAIPDKTVDEAWAAMVQFSQSLGTIVTGVNYVGGGAAYDTGITYDFTPTSDSTGFNSNSFIASILSQLNVYVTDILPLNSDTPLDPNDHFTTSDYPDYNNQFGGIQDDIFLLESEVNGINGRDGNDTADFSKIGNGLEIDLADEEFGGGSINGEIINVENIIGTSFADTITGDDNANVINAGLGVDTVDAGLGNDIIIGGNFAEGNLYNGNDGIDTIDLSSNSIGLYVDLELNTVRWGQPFSPYDSLISIENVISSTSFDQILGNATDNYFDGNGGGDSLWGKGGADTFVWKSTYGDTRLEDTNSDDIIQLVDITTDDIYGAYISNIDGFTAAGEVADFVLWYNADGLGSFNLDSYFIIRTDYVDNNEQNFDFLGINSNEVIKFRNPDGSLVSLIDLIIGDQRLMAEDQVEFGGTGNDFQVGTSLNDTISGAGGNDTISGGYGNDMLNGQSGDDVLDGGVGSDIVLGGVGNDLFKFVFQDNIGSEDKYHGQSGSDTLQLYFDITDLSSLIRGDIIQFRNFLENQLNNDPSDSSGNMYEFTTLPLVAGTFENFTVFVNNMAVSTGVEASNDMFFGLINAQITGNLLTDNGYGEDASFAGQVFAEAGTFPTSQGGSITINADGSFTYTPPNNFSGVDDYTYTADDGQGATAQATAEFGVGLPGVVAGTSTGETLNGTSGNDTMYGLGGNDTLNGSGGNDTLIGGIGNDSMSGGLGDDTYIVESTSDTVNESASAGTDSVQSSVTFTLSSNVENLTLTGIDNTDGTGNTLVNIITGNAGNNTLDGGTGADTLVGGQGNDIYIVDNASDVVTESANEGTDEIRTNITFALAANVENLTMTGSGGITGTGNALNNTMTGNSGGNTLYGGDGNDILDGAGGIDTTHGGDGDDTYYVNGNSDEIVENANEGIDLVYSTAAGHVLDANVENLTLLGTSGLSGTGNSLDNVITGNTGNNTLNGGDGNDTLDGGAGNDSMVGGIGNDTYHVDSSSDTITEGAGAGTDVVYSTAATYTLASNVENIILSGTGNISATGNALDNTLTGNSGNNTLNGSTGNDTMTGGEGDDIYVVDSASDVVNENANEGTDTIQTALAYILGAEIENLTLTGTSGVNGTGNALNNVIIGNSGANTLTGNDGNDTLDGGTGNDTMIGGLGDDIYYMNVTTDTVTENGGEGTDTINIPLTYTLLANFENLVLTGTSNINGTGNAANNVLTGNSGANILDGSTGDDTMSGGAGNDTYVVDSTSDVIVESASAGTDLVQSSASDYTLSAEVENLTLTGSSNINGTGNTLNNTITGNNGNNTLDGDAGNDTLIGGQGNDIYIVDSASDVVTEGSSAGTDLVRSTALTYTLTTNVENLTLTGGGNIDGTGNTLANNLIGNGGNNVLNGGTGADTMSGGAGDDTYVIDNAADVVIENANEGTDAVQVGFSYSLLNHFENLTLTGSSGLTGTGNALDNVIIGNSGGNTLYGGDGNDVLDGAGGIDDTYGGDGDDIYYVNGNSDEIFENANEGNDLVYSIAAAHVLDANVENLTLQGTSNISGTGNTLDNIITGNSGNNTLNGGDGNDTLDGGAGNDSLVGGQGNDTYYVDSTSDTITESSGAGTETVYSTAATYTLANNVENLILAGTGGISGTGNSLDNTITGNSGNNILDGGSGADTLVGGEGDDTYILDNSSDVVTENANEGTDTVQTNLNNYILASNVENLTLTGGLNLTATGNALDNILTGNTGSNTLYGLGGNDTLDGGSLGAEVLYGGLGDDIYIVNGSGDAAIENVNEGTDLVMSSGTYTLSNHIENLTLTGVSSVGGTGNSLDNIITGNSGNNSLNGEDGNDTLDGGAGNDVLAGGQGDDIYIIDSASDSVSESSGAGTDTVRSALAAYTLANNVENLVLTGTDNINGTGNNLVNTITGNAGNNTLDGDGGIDTLVGGAGDDIYLIDNVAEVITENLNEGTDTVQTNVNNYTLADNVENLTLTGGLNLTATGNALDNILTGSTGNNTLYGSDGNDTLDGVLGLDTLVGGDGNDTYFINGAADVVTEAANEGTDTVNATFSYTLLDNFENLILGGTSGIDGTGNGVANILTGNTGNNTLTGLAGNDTLYGSDGTDTLSGGDGNDLLYGGAGLDTMSGGNNADTFVFESASAFANIDVITDFNSGQSDKLDISELLTGYMPGTSDINDFVALSVSGGNTTVLIDRDGAGSTYSDQSVVKLNGITGLNVDDLLNNGNLIVP